MNILPRLVARPKGVLFYNVCSYFIGNWVAGGRQPSTLCRANPVNISEFGTLKESHSRLKSNFPVIFVCIRSVQGSTGKRDGTGRDLCTSQCRLSQGSSLLFCYYCRCCCCFINALCMSRFLFDGFYTAGWELFREFWEFYWQHTTSQGKQTFTEWWVHKLSF